MNKLLHKVCSTCIWCSVMLFAVFAQVDLYAQSSISGKVVDSAGEPVVGATVAYDGGSKGTATDLSGSFSIAAPAGTELVVSFIGYEKSYAKLTQGVSITLNQDENQMDEVVVIGYGSVKAKEITGSVGIVNMDDVASASVTSIDQALEGRVTGLSVVSSDGQPGSESAIVIRGVGSMSGDAGPLYVIDGFPQESSDFAQLNPEDIESMVVLKDASSTAIYGSRGANGVILITTKRGKEGKPTITYSGSLAFTRSTKDMEVMDDWTFVRYQADLVDQIYWKKYAGIGSGTTGYSANLTWIWNQSYFSNGVTMDDYEHTHSIDWVEKMKNDNPIQQTHTVSISGRKDNSGYFVSFNIADQEGLLLNSGFNRYSGRASLDQFVNENLKFGLNVSYANTYTFGDTATSSSSASNAFMNRVYMARPTSWDEESTYNLENQLLDGSWGETWSYAPDNYNPWPDNCTYYYGEQYRYNPVINSNNRDVSKTIDQLTTSAYLEAYFLDKALTLKVSGGYSLKKTFNSTFNGEGSYYGSSESATGLSDGVNATISDATAVSLLNENTLTYQKLINNDHSITAMAGFSIQENTSESHGFSATQIPDGDLGIAAMDAGNNSGMTSTGSINTLLSMFARVNYSYKSKYIVTGTVRRDGSSKFAETGKWGNFPSAAIAWRMTEEEFMQPLKNIVSDVKLRASYGVSGNNRVGDFAAQALMTTAIGDRYTFNNELYSYGTYPSTIANEALTWETTRSFDFGAEISLFKNRLNFEIDYYIKDTYDLLLSSTLATNSGYSSMTRNVGQINNTGLELAVNSVNINKKGFMWTSTFNISFNANKLVELASGEESILSGVSYLSESYIARVGYPVAQFYGYVSDGIYQESDFDCLYLSGNNEITAADGSYMTLYRYMTKDNVPYISSKLATLPGYNKFKDLNHDGAITSDDRTIIGSPYPKHTGSLSNRFSYKGFELNVYFTYSYGNELINGTIFNFANNTDARAFGLNRYAFLADYWTVYNPDAKYAALIAGGGRNNGTNNLEDGSYLRLKTVSLSYTLPKKFVAKLGLTNVRVSYSAQNLWTLTNYTGQDPEVNTDYSALTPGFDSSAYPRTSTNSFNLNITL